MTKGKLLTGLAGAAALAGASQAYGAVVVVPNPANVPGNDPATGSATPTRVFIDLDGNGTNDLQIAYRSFTSGAYAIEQSFVFSLTGQTASAPSGTQFYAYELASGAAIPGANPFGQSATYLTHVATNINGTDYGFWSLGDRGFIGFSFRNAANQLDFGYIELETDAFVSAANPGGLKFFKVAYENTGAPINAGASAIPEPSTLASLAFGGAGLAAAAYRRRKKASTAA